MDREDSAHQTLQSTTGRRAQEDNLPAPTRHDTRGGHQASTPAASAPHVVLSRVNMAYGNRDVFHGLTCSIPRGKITVILGGSGVGKSTMLRLIGGLIRPQSGSILVDGQNVTRLSERGIRQVRQKLGMMFQGGALLDSETVFDNLALPLREQTTLTRQEIADEVHAALKSVGVSDADQLLPGELSGGMLRRVALARAIIRKPIILLCDEPLSGLDPVSLRRIEGLMVKINREYGITVVVVSHDVPSTMRMADHVVLLLSDRVVEGTPEQLTHSADKAVADFFHEGMNLPSQGGNP